MADEATPQDNLDRLLSYLPVDTLAASIVKEHRKSDTPSEAMKVVIAQRLTHVRAILDGATD